MSKPRVRVVDGQIVPASSKATGKRIADVLSARWGWGIQLPTWLKNWREHRESTISAALNIRRPVKPSVRIVDSMRDELEELIDLPRPNYSQSRGRAVAPQQPCDAADTSLPLPEGHSMPIGTRYQGSVAKSGRWGFSDFGTFAQAVRLASGRDPGARAIKMIETLCNAALTTYGNEGVGADGAFAIPPAFRDNIMNKIMGVEALMHRCDVSPTANSSVVFPKDETTPWGSAGIQAYWDGEAAAMTQKKPSLEVSTHKLHKVTALVPMTNELLEDAPAMATWLEARVAQVFTFKVSDGIVNGTGAGQPLGILNAGATVSQAAEASQVADTIHGKNLVKMWCRMPAAWRKQAVWLIHPDVEPELQSAGLQINNAAGTLAVGGSLAYLAPGGLSETPYASLFGRPVIPFEGCQQLGDVGDIIFASLPQYGIFLHSPGFKAESSMHLWFDQDVTAFRFSMRLSGQPWWSSPIPNRNGGGTQSAFVTLAAR